MKTISATTARLLRLTVVTWIIFVTCGVKAADITYRTADELAGFHVIVGRGVVSGQNSGDFGGGEAWPRTGTMTESEGGTTSNDKVFVNNGTAYHDKAPHNEASNAGSVFTFSFDIIADGFSNRDYSSNNGGGKVFEHQSHFDYFLATASAKIVAHTFIGGDIKSWGMVVRGKHTTSQSDPFKGLTGTATSAQLTTPGGDENAIGSVVAFFDQTSNELDLTMEVGGMTISDFTGAQLHLGAAGSDGAAILDLGSPGMWSDLDGGGIARSLVATLSSQHVPSLLAGNTYIEIDSLSFPDGALRAQLDPTPFTLVPEPGGLIGMAALLPLMRRRRPIAG